MAVEVIKTLLQLTRANLVSVLGQLEFGQLQVDFADLLFQCLRTLEVAGGESFLYLECVDLHGQMVDGAAEEFRLIGCAVGLTPFLADTRRVRASHCNVKDIGYGFAERALAEELLGELLLCGKSGGFCVQQLLGGGGLTLDDFVLNKIVQRTGQ